MKRLENFILERLKISKEKPIFIKYNESFLDKEFFNLQELYEGLKDYFNSGSKFEVRFSEIFNKINHLIIKKFGIDRDVNKYAMIDFYKNDILVNQLLIGDFNVYVTLVLYDNKQKVISITKNQYIYENNFLDWFIHSNKNLNKTKNIDEMIKFFELDK